MIDFRIIRVRSILTVTAYQPLRNFAPPSIMVTGQGLDRTDEVVFNNVPTSEFMVVSSTRLVFKIPTDQVNKPLSMLRVYGLVPGITANGSLSLDAGRALKIEGSDRLVQSFLLVFMTTPGSDAFSRSSGGGAKSIIGKSTDTSGKVAAADISLCVERTKKELLATQAKDRRIPPSERLLAASVSNVAFNPATTALTATIDLTNALGVSAQFNLNG